jgi:16S rRNA A1518/A1519 N6-dimethyltransferase RsmA/KsgA/DIM1 with predicted DNA glycosylase/AP lyase activity
MPVPERIQAPPDGSRYGSGYVSCQFRGNPVYRIGRLIPRFRPPPAILSFALTTARRTAARKHYRRDEDFFDAVFVGSREFQLIPSRTQRKDRL